MSKFLPLAAAGLALVGMVPAASAATQLGEYFSFSGFGTLGGVQTNSDAGKFGRDRQVGGADKQASFEVDSNLGLQLTGTATPWLSATLQMLAAKRDKDRIEADAEWAFVTIKPVDGLTLRGGRMAAPVFAVSDSRNVGYANTWVRAPNEVYALNVFRNLDGADATYRHALGPATISITGFAGKTKFKALGGSDASGDHLKGVNLQVDTDWVNLRLGRMTTTVVIPAIRETGDRYAFNGVGLTVDRDNIVAQAELVRRTSRKQPGGVNAESWYVLGGYRFGSVMPYAIYSSTKPKTPRSPILLSAEQKTIALGVRWDAFTSAALKLQVDRIDTNDSKGISFTTPPSSSPFPGGPRGSQPVNQPVTAASIALDFTF